MDMLRNFFPYSFREKKDVTALIINISVYLVVGFVAGILIGLLAIIPIIGIIIGIIGSILDLYVFIGIILSVLDYMKVLK